MGRDIFITGASGFLGKLFARLLAKEEPGQILLLLRPRGDETPEQRLKSISLDMPDIRPVPGDIADPAIVEKLSGLSSVGEFWHIAGLTEFHENKRPQLEQVNIEGTRHALTLAKRWGVSRFFHISTAYVAGISPGPVPEDGLLPNPIFRNAYEETKYRGEQLVRASGVPWIVIRPSILMGDSVTGKAESDKMAYGVCKVYHALARWVRREQRDNAECNGHCYCLRASDKATKNCVCVDDAVRLMLAVRQRGEVHKTYHCCHTQPTTMGHLHSAGAKAVNAPFIELRAAGVPTPDRKQRFMDKGCRTYEPYMLQSDPLFDLTNTKHIEPAFQPAPMTPDRLNTLFEVYVESLRETEQQAEETTLELSRLDAVRRYGSFALAYNTLSRQFAAFTTDAADGFLPYAMVDKTAIVAGDPVTDNPCRLLADFIRWCDSANRRLCALQISRATAAALRSLGCCVNKLGIETFIDVQRLDAEFRGGEYERLRGNMNPARRMGITVKEQPIAERTRDELQHLFTEWLDQKKNHRELRLLLRPPSLEPEPDVRHFTADYGGRLIAAVFFTPIYRAERIIGYYADIERYNTAGTDLPGRLNLMKLIQYEAARVFQREGIEIVALGMSPLHRVGESEFNDNPELTALFEQLFEESTLYAFRGIALHKRLYPCRIERPVYVATRTHTAADEVLDLLKGVGLLG